MKDIRSIYNQAAEEYIEYSRDLDSLSIGSLEKFAAAMPRQARILDYGCGSGVYGKWLHDKDYNVQAMDISDEMVLYVTEHFPELSPTRGDIGDVLEGCFDGIWCNRVFHHISLASQGIFVDKMARALKPQGVLYITCAHDDRDYEQNDSVNGALKKRLTVDSFVGLMTSHGFSQIFSKPWSNGWSEYMFRLN